MYDYVTWPAIGIKTCTKHFSFPKRKAIVTSNGSSRSASKTKMYSKYDTEEELIAHEGHSDGTFALEEL